MRMIRAKEALSQLLWHSLGRKNYARLGRYLWMQARLDVANDIHHNGETLLHKAFARGAAERGPLRVLDVGANVGEWSRLLLQACESASLPSSRIDLHLFEPGPEARARLSQAFAPRAANLAGLHVVGSAVSSSEGEVTFQLYGEGGRRSALRQLEPGLDVRTITVPQTTLDAYAAKSGIERVDLLKIDTEGNDFLVLRGARELLAAGRVGLVQFEYNQRWIAFRSYLKDVFDLVQPLGYRVGKITPRGVETYGAWHFELESFREGNYLLWRGALPGAMPSFAWWMDAP